MAVDAEIVGGQKTPNEYAGEDGHSRPTSTYTSSWIRTSCSAARNQTARSRTDEPKGTGNFVLNICRPDFKFLIFKQEEKEGPVTKSIRLTSALILRNIATHSPLGRRYYLVICLFRKLYRSLMFLRPQESSTLREPFS